jgi:hypothetical protein
MTVHKPNLANHWHSVAFTARRSPRKWVAGFIRSIHAGMLSRGPGRLIRNSERNGGASMCKAEKAIISKRLKQSNSTASCTTLSGHDSFADMDMFS